MEAATLAAIALIVGFTFRSVAAPLITLVTAGTGYLLADRVLGLVGQLTGLAAPSQMQPVIVALMLGITTDYAIFFMSGVQRRLREGVAGPRVVGRHRLARPPGARGQEDRQDEERVRVERGSHAETIATRAPDRKSE